MRRWRHIVGALTLLAIAVAAAACGGSSSGTETVVGIREAKGSGVLVDPSGRGLYTFSRGVDCTGDCAASWLPFKADGDVVVEKDSGLNQDLLGTTKRADGSAQVTYDGEPLYVHADGTPADGSHEFGGSWELVRLPIDPLKREKARGSCEPNCGY